MFDLFSQIPSFSFPSLSSVLEMFRALFPPLASRKFAWRFQSDESNSNGDMTSLMSVHIIFIDP